MNRIKPTKIMLIIALILLVGCGADGSFDAEAPLQSVGNSCIYGISEMPHGEPNIPLVSDYSDEKVLYDVHNNSTDMQCEATSLYLAFLESSDWVWVDCHQCCGRVQSTWRDDWRITDKTIFDFDGDGVPDLWFRAVWGEDEFISPRWSNSITGFATIVDGEVVLLLSGYTTGGSIGGDFITSAYDQETSEYVIVVHSFVGGFGGIFNGSRFYSMQNGKLTRLYSICVTYYWATQGREEEYLFTVNGEDVSFEIYVSILYRFAAPIGGCVLYCPPTNRSDNSIEIKT